jgi:hypothetical protein
MSFGRLPRHPIQTKDAARNQEEQRRFEMMTVSWDEAKLRRACKILSLPEEGCSVDQMQMTLVQSQVHRLASDLRVHDPEKDCLVWPDPWAIFNRDF